LTQQILSRDHLIDQNDDGDNEYGSFLINNLIIRILS
jgi:hypothetical protein